MVWGTIIASAIIISVMVGASLGYTRALKINNKFKAKD